MLRACSFTLALASRNEGLVAAVERDRVKVRDVEALGAEDARTFTAAKDMTELRCFERRDQEKNVEESSIYCNDSTIKSCPTKSDLGSVLPDVVACLQHCGPSHSKSPKKWQQRLLKSPLICT